MKLNLTRPLCIFDLETTGLDFSKDHIIQIAYIIVQPDGSEESFNRLINPGKDFLGHQIAIPQMIQELTSITDEMVADKPTFREIAQELAEQFKDCDFAGYNSNGFDIPMLCEEFLRAGIDFDFHSRRLIDACNIFKQMERRNLAAAYKFYCGRKMEDDFQAHLADQDTAATWAVLQGELDKYAPGANEDPEKVLENDMDKLHEFCNQRKIIDFAGRLYYDEEGNEIISFGKYKGMKCADVFPRDPGYVNWVLSGDFTMDTKRQFERIALKYARR